MTLLNTATTAPFITAKIGLPAPAFSMLSTQFNQEMERNLTLDDYRGKWLILFFWPFDFTFVCPTEIIAFSDSYKEFQALDCEIVGASVDSIHTHRAWMNAPRDQGGIGEIHYPMASDINKTTAKAYGILDDESGGAHRGLFIIDPEGVLRYQVVTDMNVGRSVDETLRILQALQAGGLCPANWRPGQKTL
ncbi:thioredoxin peroxidase [Paenibacillus swuensis]|uniref:Alkyl hydroperoxide reductase C n=1 Tax=Paenibacillus swuensis TaxID=1178515 RepID=A0A172TMW5_9BACL|nr:peroxiredoxin [Paenibacillus swuensis]ANE48370.1 thioredoxin peroxidase [Paenibacillus swuensis]